MMHNSYGGSYSVSLSTNNSFSGSSFSVSLLTTNSFPVFISYVGSRLSKNQTHLSDNFKINKVITNANIIPKITGCHLYFC